MSVERLASLYHEAVQIAHRAAVDAEEEAQLTTPVSQLFSGIADEAGLGTLHFIRETRLDGSRPDFAALLERNGNTQQKGFVELKAPTISVDVNSWRGRNARQWEKMSPAAEIIIVCNGHEAQLYWEGEAITTPASLPYDSVEGWDHSELLGLLGRFIELTPTPIVDVASLSRRLAWRTAELRDRLLWLLDQRDAGGDEARTSFRAWRQHVYARASERDFADGVSQVIAYGMVLAVLTQNPDVDENSHITVDEARASIRQSSPVLAAAFAPLIDREPLAQAVRIELGALETLVSAVQPEQVNTSADRRGDPWLFFYEDFLEVYDPNERRQAGVYYTPVAIVQAMTAMTDHLLTERFGRRLGFADQQVVTLDPATGTGTFPLAVIDRAIQSATRVRGEAGPRQAARNLRDNLFAFEMLPGPYSVAHLRLTQRLAQLSDSELGMARVVLTDTLESPNAAGPQMALFGDAETLAAEQERARTVKLEQQVTVVIGNPPYRRVERDIEGRGSGGWVINGEVPGQNESLFHDIHSIANENTIFSHIASLYNLYVYFWRWGIWKAFEAHGEGPGVVAYITASSWLTGPGFMGLRKVVREICDDIWVIDLGGDNRGANPEENVFAIETPVSIVLLSREGASDRDNPANVFYRRISGSSSEKLSAMELLASHDDPFEGDWEEAPTGWLDPLVPPTGSANWDDLPKLTDLFPWQQPGCMFSRTWPIGQTVNMLNQRWSMFAEASRREKPTLYVTPNSGRNVNTRVGDLPRLIETQAGDPSEPIVRYAMRSFDRQWAFDDARLAKTESPALWQSRSDNQIFFASLMTGEIANGPALTMAIDVPDKHFFRGSYGGKDIIPLYRDAEAREPNLTEGLSEFLADRLDIAAPSPEDIAAYVYAITSAFSYQIRFAEELRTPGLRIPITEDSTMWAEAVDQGEYLIWLHSYAERMCDQGDGRGSHVPAVDGLGWAVAATRLPTSNDDFSYDADTRCIEVANGRIEGVDPEVWDFSVSGMQVVSKWLGYRTASPPGRAASSGSELDQIRPEEWPDEWNDELLDLLRVLAVTLERQTDLSDLLDRVMNGSLIPTGDFPAPNDRERQPPVRVTQQSLPF